MAGTPENGNSQLINPPDKPFDWIRHFDKAQCGQAHHRCDQDKAEDGWQMTESGFLLLLSQE